MDKSYFDNAKAQIKIFREKMRDEGKEFFSGCAKELFSTHPILDYFSWTQYTPYFNDGDPCEFSAHTDYPAIGLVGAEETEDEDEEDYFSADETSPEAVAWRAVTGFLSKFDDDDFQLMFGDHAKIVVSRSGGVDIQEYSHD